MSRKTFSYSEAGPMKGGSSRYIVLGPTVTDGPETEGIFVYLLLTNSE